jgi:hypothetical protein
VWLLRGNAAQLKHGKWWGSLECGLDSSDSELMQRLWLGKAFREGEWPSPSPVFRYEEVGSKPDITEGSDAIIVSDRLRLWLEREEPKSCQFLPLRISGPKRRTLYKRYWVVNCLNRWHCQPDPTYPEVDADKIPADQHLGVVTSWTREFGKHAFCSDALRRRLLKQGFVGVRFDVVHTLANPRSLIRFRGIGMTKAILVERRTIPRIGPFDVDAHLRQFPNNSYRSPIPGANALYEYVLFCGGDDPRTIRKLLESGCELNIGRDQSHMNPVLINVPKTPAIVRTLARFRADWNTRNSVGITPLMSAMQDASPRALRLMLSTGADARARDMHGQNALHHLASDVSLYPCSLRRCRAVAKLMVASGARLDVTNADGETPIDIVAKGLELQSESDKKKLVEFSKYLQYLARSHDRDGKRRRTK